MPWRQYTPEDAKPFVLVYAGPIWGPSRRCTFCSRRPVYASPIMVRAPSSNGDRVEHYWADGGPAEGFGLTACGRRFDWNPFGPPAP